MGRSVLTGFLFVCVLSLFSFQSFGQNTPNRYERKVIRVEGLPVAVEFKDGHVAHMEMAFGDWAIVPFSAKWSQSLSCNIKTLGETCSVKVPVAIDQYRLRWVQHPDPKKVGTLVKYSNHADFFATEFSIGFGTLDRPTPDPVRMSCQGGEVPAKSILVDAWLTEFNLFNYQTEVTENQIFGGRYNVKIQSDNSDWIITDPGLFFGEPGISRFSAGLLGDVITLYSDQLGKDCTVKFKGNVNEFLGKFAKLKPGSSFTLYKYKKGGLADREELLNNLLFGGFE